MTKIHKKVLTVFMTLVLVVFGLTLFAPSVYADEHDTVAYIGYASEDWETQYWGPGVSDVVVVNPIIDGLGDYTASLDFTETDRGYGVGFAFFALEIVDGDRIFGDNTYVQINSIKINDVEISFDTPYTGSEHETDDDELIAIHTRVNLYNEWVGSDIADYRTINGSRANLNPTPVDIDDLDEELTSEIETIVIEFTFREFQGFDPIAYLQIGSGGWATQYWYDGASYDGVTATNILVEDYGQYTVALEFDTPFNGVEFFDVEILNGESEFPRSFMQIDEVKINNEVVEVGATYTSSDNESETRTNLYNAWVGNIVEGRTLDGDIEDISATPVSSSDFVDVEIIEVTFTLLERGVKIGAQPLPEDGTKAYLQFANENWSVQYWYDDPTGSVGDVSPTHADIMDYDIQYTVGLDFTDLDGGNVDNIFILEIGIEDGELYFPGVIILVDEVRINGEVVEIGYTFTTSTDEQTTQLYLNNPYADVEGARTAPGVPGGAITTTPLDVEEFEDITSIEVTFTLLEGSYLPPEEYEVPESFRAFLMFSDETEVWQRYDAGLELPGDTVVTGDGTYVVYLRAEDLDVTSQAGAGQVFLVDIIGLGRAMRYLGTLDDENNTDLTVTVKVWVDGVELSVTQSRIIVGDLEGNDRLRIELFNTWGGTSSVPVVAPAELNPAEEIRVEFTLTGTGITNGEPVDPDPTDPDPTDPDPTDPDPTDPADGNNQTLIIVLSVIGGLIAVGAAGAVLYFFVLKKKP